MITEVKNLEIKFCEAVEQKYHEHDELVKIANREMELSGLEKELITKTVTEDKCFLAFAYKHYRCERLINNEQEYGPGDIELNNPCNKKGRICGLGCGFLISYAIFYLLAKNGRDDLLKYCISRKISETESFVDRILSRVTRSI
jgi:hypothetical protein